MQRDKASGMLSSTAESWCVQEYNITKDDTVVAVHALSSLAKLIYSEDNSVNIDVISGDITKSFTVDDSNRFILQTALLKGSPGDVSIHGTGTGRAVVQVSVRFNIADEFIEPAFSANVTVTKQSSSAFDIEVCAAYLLKGASGMTYIEVLTPTGFSPVPETELKLQLYGKRVETTDKSVILYLDELTADDFCFPVSAIRTALVAKVQPVTVTVFDYYEPDQKVVTFYLPEVLQDNDFCDVCDGDHCQMCQARRK
ncbi:CD109 antigen-like [Liolophura sinensis]|uniref:CD109 antigen-like n=1 Tax=Liolophura sinensis TaxID=3198878 RepID=UPI0031587D69